MRELAPRLRIVLSTSDLADIVVGRGRREPDARFEAARAKIGQQRRRMSCSVPEEQSVAPVQACVASRSLCLGGAAMTAVGQAVARPSSRCSPSPRTTKQNQTRAANELDRQTGMPSSRRQRSPMIGMSAFLDFEPVQVPCSPRRARRNSSTAGKARAIGNASAWPMVAGPARRKGGATRSLSEPAARGWWRGGGHPALRGARCRRARRRPRTTCSQLSSTISVFLSLRKVIRPWKRVLRQDCKPERRSKPRWATSRGSVDRGQIDEAGDRRHRIGDSLVGDSKGDGGLADAAGDPRW